ncbi:MAG: hypothetical protein ACRC5H_10390 [Treponemataceae bacterium]
MKSIENSKKCAEEKIEELAQQFFSITKTDEDSSVARQIYRTKLWTAIWMYCKKFQYAKKVEDEICVKNRNTLADKFSLEINQAILSSFNNYKSEKGKFLNYLLRSLRNAIFEGRKTARKDKRNMRCEYQTQSDGEEVSVFDTLPSNFVTPEEHFDSTESLQRCLHLFQLIEKTFNESQQRKKPYLSALLTQKFYDEIHVFEIKTKKKYTFSFVDEEILTAEKKPKQQEVAACFERDKSDASRTINKFIKKLEENCQLLEM